jgi:hypothetical protein
METAFKALSRAGLWEVAPAVVRRALLEEATEEGRRAAASMEAPDVGELIRAHLVFHLVDREAKDGEVNVPFLAPRPGCITRAFQSLGCREKYTRSGTTMYWAMPRQRDRDMDDVVVVNTMPSGFLHPLDSPEMYSVIEGFQAHVTLNVVCPTPDTVGAMLADITGALLTHGATGYRHVLRLSPVCCSASYKLSESVVQRFEYLFPFVRKSESLETALPPGHSGHSGHFPDFFPAPLIIRLDDGDPWVELIGCHRGPSGARDILRHVDQKWIRRHRSNSPENVQWQKYRDAAYAANKWKRQQVNTH